MDTKILSVDKKFGVKALRFIQKALSKDKDRPALQGAGFVEGFTYAIDGYRMHAVQWEFGTCAEPLRGLYAPVGNIAEATVFMEVEGAHPTPERLQQIIPTSRQPQAVVALNPDFLRDALTNADTPVTLVIYGDDQPVEIYGSINGTPTYSLTMPYHKGAKMPWRPFVPYGEQPKEETSNGN